MQNNKPRLVDHDVFLDEITDKLERCRIEDAEATRTKSFVEGYITSIEHAETKRSDGVRVEDDIIGMMNQMLHRLESYVFSAFQQNMIDEILRMCSNHIMRGMTEDKKVALLAKNNMVSPEQQIFYGRTSRRGGKTDTLTVCAALFLIFIMDIKILYFSLYEGTCKIACNTVQTWLNKFGFKKNIDYRATSLNIKFISTRAEITFITSQTPNVRNFFIVYYVYHYYYYYCRRCHRRRPNRKKANL
jgi:hypothetical protein